MVLVMSYNVAGWVTTLTIILQQYGSLGAWLERHGIDRTLLVLTARADT